MSSSGAALAEDTYGGELGRCRDVFERANAIADLTHAFLLFLTVQFRVHSIDEVGHFLNLDETERVRFPRVLRISESERTTTRVPESPRYSRGGSFKCS